MGQRCCFTLPIPIGGRVAHIMSQREADFKELLTKILFVGCLLVTSCEWFYWWVDQRQRAQMSLVNLTCIYGLANMPWHFTIASHSGQMPASTQLYIETILTELQILDWMLPVIEGTWDHNLTMGIGTPTLVSKYLVHLGFSYRSMLQSSVISRPCHHWLLGWSEGHFRAIFQELSGLSCVRHSPREVNSWWLFPPKRPSIFYPLKRIYLPGDPAESLEFCLDKDTWPQELCLRHNLWVQGLNSNEQMATMIGNLGT